VRARVTLTYSEDHCSLNDASDRDADLTETTLHVLSDSNVTLEQVDTVSQCMDATDNTLRYVVSVSPM
jgi:hypothetical protein